MTNILPPSFFPIEYKQKSSSKIKRKFNDTNESFDTTGPSQIQNYKPDVHNEEDEDDDEKPQKENRNDM